MSQLCAGFARVNITPPMGMPIAGYYQVRLAEKVLEREIDEDDGHRFIDLTIDRIGKSHDETGE